jgi:hypothetical protein
MLMLTTHNTVGGGWICTRLHAATWGKGVEIHCMDGSYIPEKILCVDREQGVVIKKRTKLQSLGAVDHVGLCGGKWTLQ